MNNPEQNPVWQTPNEITVEGLGLDPDNVADRFIINAAQGDGYLAMLLLTQEEIMDPRERHERDPMKQKRLQESLQTEIQRRRQQLGME